MKKSIIYILLTIGCFLKANAQYTIEYVYDNSGNRTSRTIITLPAHSSTPNDTIPPAIGEIMVTGAIGGMAGGYAGGFTANLMMGGDLSSANQAGLNGLKMGAFIGAGTGSFGGYRYAKQHNLNPWTGKSLTPAPPKTISIYRAVSIDEYNDINSNGLRTNPNGRGYQEGKLFYKSYQDAINNTSAYDAAFGQKSTIIKIDIPYNTSQNFNYFHMDGYDVIYINAGDLPSINNVMTINKY